MYYYHLKVCLYTNQTAALQANTLLDPIAGITIPIGVSDRLKEYHKQRPPQSHSGRTRRPSRRQIHIPNIPPTPVHSPKQHADLSLTRQTDFRLGLIQCEYLHTSSSKNYAAAAKNEGLKTTVTNLGCGILHLYRDERDVQLECTAEEGAGRLLCILAVPTYLSTDAFLNFITPAATSITRCCFLRDRSPNKYVVVLEFHDDDAAKSFYDQFNEKQYSVAEPELCHVVYLKSTALDIVKLEDNHIPFLKETLEADTQQQKMAASKEVKESRCELPTCPVCLERMDESITGLASLKCQHSFHCFCLNKWGSGICPACNYSQKPVIEGSSDNRNQFHSLSSELPITECFICGSTESLWICMVCGHIGCGRYQDAHAYNHYMQTGHLYALEIATQRVWDYMSDGYIQRILQNMVDGKLVEFPSKSTQDEKQPLPTQERLEAISLEYTYMMTSQLDSQRIYYEDQLAELTLQLSELNTHVHDLSVASQEIENEHSQLTASHSKLQQEISSIDKENEKMDRRSKLLMSKYQIKLREWLEEKELTTSLRHNTDLLKKEAEQNERAIQNLAEQVQDLMFFLESRSKVEKDPEMAGADIVTRPENNNDTT